LLTPGVLSHLEEADTRGPIRAPRLVFKADVRGGNSGGPLLDGSGLVIGIVFAELNSAHYLRATGRTVIDVGFAIPVPSAAQFLARHGVKLTGAPAGPALDKATLHAEAARHVVRVNCLR
jgi:S1-C subfamily serine protease